ncbi:MAG: mercury transporter MerT [Luteitalea sp.]|nr:mercury transporter MerT [Luteitalea sp.]
MKTVVATVVTAIAASACCIGPVLLSLVGAGALGAAATRLEPWRPVLLGLTAVLLGAAFVVTYRRSGEACAADGTCTPAATRRVKILLWVITILVIAVAAFPYYVGWFV